MQTSTQTKFNWRWFALDFGHKRLQQKNVFTAQTKSVCSVKQFYSIDSLSISKLFQALHTKDHFIQFRWAKKKCIGKLNFRFCYSISPFVSVYLVVCRLPFPVGLCRAVPWCPRGIFAQTKQKKTTGVPTKNELNGSGGQWEGREPPTGRITSTRKSE